MNKFSIYFIVLAAIFTSGCASEQPANTASGAAEENATELADNTDSGNDPDELICRREMVTGTNFRRRVCMTRAERDQRRQETQEAVLNNRSTTQGLPSGSQ